MTVIRAPRMTPRTVSSLMFPPARSACSRAILSPLQIVALSGWRRSRMAADRAPASLVVHPHVSQKDAILDYATEILHSPPGMNSANHNLVERRCVAHFQLDRIHVAPLDCV